MASVSGIASWLLSNTEKLQLQCQPITWVQDWFDGHFDFEVSICTETGEHTGRGIANSEELAFVKAGAEALERAAAHAHGLRTSGIAAHITEELAATNAKAELLERDAFFCHYLTNSPLIAVDASEVFVAGHRFNELNEKLSGEWGVCLNLLRLKAANDIFCHAVIAEGMKSKRPFGVIVGLGTSAFDNSESVSKATFECLINVMTFLEGNEWSSLTSSQFQKLEAPTIADHFRLGLDVQYGIQFTRELIARNSGYFSAYSGQPINDVHVRSLAPPSDFSDCPLHFSQATSASLQKAFWGHLANVDLNMNRLRAFSNNSELKASEVRLAPHPLG